MRGVEQIPWLYDLLLAALERLGLGALRQRLAGRARGRTLDLGCGTGRDLPPLLRAGVPRATLVGLDPSWDALRRARRRAPGVPLVRAVAEALPFREGAFDAVVGGLVLCSVPDPAGALAEVRRVLADGGALELLEHVRSPRPGVARLQDRLQPLWTRAMGGCHPNRDTEAAVRAAGFQIDPESRVEACHVVRLFSARPRR